VPKASGVRFQKIPLNAMSKLAVHELLQNNLFDVKIIRDLEAYFATQVRSGFVLGSQKRVCCQVKSGQFDADANRHLLKLYACSPEAFNRDVVGTMRRKPSPFRLQLGC
jgi:hypothetical protein